MTKTKVGNPFKKIHQKLNQTQQDFRNVKVEFELNKRLDESRVFEITCEETINVFDKKVKDVNCDVNIKLDKEPKKDEKELAKISLGFGSDAVKESKKEKDDS